MRTRAPPVSFARAAPLPTKGYKLIRDKKLLGFCLRLTAQGSRAWAVDKWSRSRAQPLRIAIAPIADIAAEVARKHAHQLIGKLHAGVDPVADYRGLLANELALIAGRRLSEIDHDTARACYERLSRERGPTRAAYAMRLLNALARSPGGGTADGRLFFRACHRAAVQDPMSTKNRGFILPIPLQPFKGRCFCILNFERESIAPLVSLCRFWQVRGERHPEIARRRRWTACRRTTPPSVSLSRHTSPLPRGRPTDCHTWQLPRRAPRPQWRSAVPPGPLSVHEGQVLHRTAVALRDGHSIQPLGFRRVLLDPWLARYMLTRKFCASASRLGQRSPLVQRDLIVSDRPGQISYASRVCTACPHG